MVPHWLPVWAATELMDWGSLTYLYGFSPRDVQDAVAGACELRAPQLTSWLKALNLVRNTCAHHGRLFNRVHTIAPKLPNVGLHPDLDSASTEWNRTFARLTFVQFLSDRLGVGRSRILPRCSEGLSCGDHRPDLPHGGPRQLAGEPTLDDKLRLVQRGTVGWNGSCRVPSELPLRATSPPSSRCSIIQLQPSAPRHDHDRARLERRLLSLHG